MIFASIEPGPSPVFSTRPYVFVHVPKNAGMSIVKVVGTIWGKRDIMGDTGTALLYRREIGEEAWEKAFKFSFVRNPWDRAVSAWHFARRKDMTGASTLRSFLQELPRTNRTSYDKRWVRWHTSPQCFHLVDEDGALMVDFVGRIERLQEDFDEVCRRLEAPRTRLPRRNSSEHASYLEYYDEETIHLVSELYREDIERFGYRFGENG